MEETASLFDSDCGRTEAAESEGAMVPCVPETPVVAEDPVMIAQHKLRQSIMEDLEGILDRYGGPIQYLEHIDKKAFGEWLWDTFPELDDCLYQHKSNFPTVKESELAESTPLLFHVSALGLDGSSSLKPSPGKAFCLQLAEQFLLEGFLTSTSHAGPLLIQERRHWLPGSDQPLLWQDAHNDLIPFSLGYLKGMARSSSLLFLLHRISGMSIDVLKELPMLHQTVSKIHCHHVKINSRVDEALCNMRMSRRGSMVKATNTLQAVIMVKQLVDQGLTTHMQFIRSWNQQASKQFQFVGKRLTALKLLFEDTPKDPSLECFLVLICLELSF